MLAVSKEKNNSNKEKNGFKDHKKEWERLMSVQKRVLEDQDDKIKDLEW